MLKLKIITIKSFLFLLILNTSQALAISGKEIKELINASPLERLEIWMAKEAVSKATGDGMSIAKEVAIVGDNAYYESSVFRIIRYEYKCHKIVVAIDYSDSSTDN